jgi:hypothetical protein
MFCVVSGYAAGNGAIFYYDLGGYLSDSLKETGQVLADQADTAANLACARAYKKRDSFFSQNLNHAFSP